MTSAALDACLCLLLVSAAALTVASAPTPDTTVSGDADRADAVAETLAATTADVPYRLQPVPGSHDDGSPEFDRVAHGTLASLLADAAVRTVRVDDEALTGTSEGFASAVRETVSERLPKRTRVVVRWKPYPGSSLGRQFAVGPAPPADADVHAETVRAPAGVSGPSSVSTAAESGFNALGRSVADSLVAGLFPPAKGRLALADDAPLDDLVRHRYRRAGEVYEVETEAAIERGDTHAANRRLAASMGERVAEELQGEFDDPAAAADSLELHTVEISVRTWSP